MGFCPKSLISEFDVKNSSEDFLKGTLRSGINVLMGISNKKNKLTVENDCSGKKILHYI